MVREAPPHPQPPFSGYQGGKKEKTQTDKTIFSLPSCFLQPSWRRRPFDRPVVPHTGTITPTPTHHSPPDAPLHLHLHLHHLLSSILSPPVLNSPHFNFLLSLPLISDPEQPNTSLTTPLLPLLLLSTTTFLCFFLLLPADQLPPSHSIPLHRRLLCSHPPISFHCIVSCAFPASNAPEPRAHSTALESTTFILPFEGPSGSTPAPALGRPSLSPSPKRLPPSTPSSPPATATLALWHPVRHRHRILGSRYTHRERPRSSRGCAIKSSTRS